MIVRSRVPELRLVARLHVDLQRVSSAVCMPAA
ncbi:MAG: putative leader peptide [Acidothermaceae bacterium]